MHILAAHSKRTRTHAHTYTCKGCDLRFESKKDMYAHKRTHTHTPAKYTCEKCSCVFSFKYELNRHTQTHMPCTQKGVHDFVCAFCGLHVASTAALKIHLHRFHAARTQHTQNAHNYLCAYCGHLSRTRKSFAAHTRTHEDSHTQKTEEDENLSAKPRKIECGECHKVMLATSLRTHTHRMHGEAVHVCVHCHERFCVRSDLMRHINSTHTAHNPYVCQEIECSEAFNTSDALR